MTGLSIRTGVLPARSVAPWRVSVPVPNGPLTSVPLLETELTFTIAFKFEFVVRRTPPLNVEALLLNATLPDTTVGSPSIEMLLVPPPS